MKEIGISEGNRASMAEVLTRLLADVYAVYLKTHGFHWNVKGPAFYAIHSKLEEHYEALAEVVDSIAERIVQLGHRAPASFSELSQLTQIQEQHDFSDTEKMLEEMAENHALLIRSARSASIRAGEVNDNATCGLLDGFIQSEEKLLWMLTKVSE